MGRENKKRSKREETKVKAIKAEHRKVKVEQKEKDKLEYARRLFKRSTNHPPIDMEKMLSEELPDLLVTIDEFSVKRFKRGIFGETIKNIKKHEFDESTKKALRIFALTAIGVTAVVTAGSAPIITASAEMAIETIIAYLGRKAAIAFFWGFLSGAGMAALSTQNTIPEETLQLLGYLERNSNETLREKRETNFIESIAWVVEDGESNSFIGKIVSKEPKLEELGKILNSEFAGFDEKTKGKIFTILEWFYQEFNKYIEGHKDISQLFNDINWRDFVNNNLPSAIRSIEILNTYMKDYANAVNACVLETDEMQKIVLNGAIREIVNQVELEIEFLSINIKDFLSRMHPQKELSENPELEVFVAGFKTLERKLENLDSKTKEFQVWLESNHINNETMNNQSKSFFENNLDNTVRSSLILGLLDGAVFFNTGNETVQTIVNESKNTTNIPLAVEIIKSKENLQLMIQISFNQGATEIFQLASRIRLEIYNFLIQIDPREMPVNNNEILIIDFELKTSKFFHHLGKEMKKFAEILDINFSAAFGIYNSLIIESDNDAKEVEQMNKYIKDVKSNFEAVYNTLIRIIEREKQITNDFFKFLKTSKQPLLDIVFFVHWPETFQKINNYFLVTFNVLESIMLDDAYNTPSGIAQIMEIQNEIDKKLLSFQEVIDGNSSIFLRVFIDIILNKKAGLFAVLETDFKKIKTLAKQIIDSMNSNLTISEELYRELNNISEDITVDISELTFKVSELDDLREQRRQYEIDSNALEGWDFAYDLFLNADLIEKFKDFKKTTFKLSELLYYFNIQKDRKAEFLGEIKLVAKEFLVNIENNKLIPFLQKQFSLVQQYIKYFEKQNNFKEFFNLNVLLSRQRRSVEIKNTSLYLPIERSMSPYKAIENKYSQESNNFVDTYSSLLLGIPIGAASIIGLKKIYDRFKSKLVEQQEVSSENASLCQTTSISNPRKDGLDYENNPLLASLKYKKPSLSLADSLEPFDESESILQSVLPIEDNLVLEIPQETPIDFASCSML